MPCGVTAQGKGLPSPQPSGPGHTDLHGEQAGEVDFWNGLGSSPLPLLQAAAWCLGPFRLLGGLDQVPQAHPTLLAIL